jgi:LAS superfamily LD-carboxypeptidase LdcB
MAVNAQKLLPPAKLTAGERMSAAYDKKIDDLLNLKIKKKLINVEKIVNKTKKVKEKTKRDKKVSKENEKRKVKEDRLEKDKQPETKVLGLPNLPKTGFLDSVQNFLGYTFLGYLFTNYNDNLPQLKKVVNLLPAAMDTFGKVLIGTLDFSSALIAGGYKAKEDLSKQIKSLGGENAQKQFDDATNSFKELINSILTLGLYKPSQTSVPQKTNGGLVTKMAVGGNVTRMNRPVGGQITREIKATKIKPSFPVVYKQETQPGKDIGGSKKIERIFPKSINPQKPGPLNSLISTSSELKKVPLIGSLMSAAVDIAMGQKPNRKIYKTFGQSIAYLMGPSIENQSNAAMGNLTSVVAKMASGGSIPVSRQITTNMSSTERFVTQLSNIFQIAIENRLSRIFSQILKTKNASDTIEDIERTGEYGDIEYGPLPLGMSEKQAFATIYELAKKNNASMPELVAGMAMHESGYLRSLLAKEYNNPFGQTGSGTKGSVVITGSDGKQRTFAVYNSLEDAVKVHVRDWNNDSKLGKGAGTYPSAVDGLKAILPTYAPTSDGNNHSNYIRSVSSILSTMGFNPRKKNPKVDLSTTALIQQRRPTSAGTIPGSKAIDPRVLDQNETVPVEGRFRLRADAAKAYLDMKGAAASEGVRITLTSAWRSYQEQKYLYDNQNKPGFNPAAAPGTSKHEFGLAIDVANGIPWVTRHGSRFGWIATVPGEPWHFEFNGSYTPQASRQKTQRVSSSTATPTTANIASSTPRVSNTANQIAMTPAYDDIETVFILKEKIVLKEVASQNMMQNNQGTIAFPGVNSTIPTLVG